MTERLENWIGRETVRDDIVTPRLVAEFTTTLAPHLFAPSSPGECPPGLHFAVAPAIPALAGLAPDGAEAHGGFLPPLTLPHRMWAGGRIETIRPLSIGAQVRRVSKVADVKMRDGKSGPLCFISITHELTSDGTVAVRERQDLVFRGQPSAHAAAGAAADASGDLVWQVEATPVLLFRFSAMTFNSHRIHYDLAHATETEAYPGLIVHGPLQAVLLLSQLAVLRGAVPPAFEYRCTAPLVAGKPFHVVSTGDHARIVDAAGVMTSEGHARIS